MADVQPLSFTPPDVDPATFGFAFCEGGVCAAQGVKASGTHAGFRADPAGLGEQPTTHLRLAGAVRPETGRRQRLCYCVP